MKLLSIRTWPIWDFLFPPICGDCGRPLTDHALLYCAQCWTDAPRIEAKDLPKLRHVDHVSAVYAFREGNLIQGAVHALKYDGYYAVGREMARRMAQRLPDRFRDVQVAWTAVPQHWLRRMERTFNQSEFIARELAKLTGHENRQRALVRIRHTPTQTAQTFKDRVANVRGAFNVNLNRELPKSVLLIDDVITTGATVNECARTLKAAGVEWVGAFSFALAGLTKQGTAK